MDIKAIREKYGYTQEELAIFLGVSVVTVCKWEQNVNNPGKRSRRDLIEKFPELKEE